MGDKAQCRAVAASETLQQETDKPEADATALPVQALLVMRSIYETFSQGIISVGLCICAEPW
jgi:hypothetical protein